MGGGGGIRGKCTVKMSTIVRTDKAVITLSWNKRSIDGAIGEFMD